MATIEAVEQYSQALKAGQKHYRDCVARGAYPYPQVLDEILDESTVSGVQDIGIVNVPAELVCGIKNAGRRSAFAANFMPLLAPGTEFAMKWTRLCEAHLSDEGIREPVSCYEYMGRFYVEEGNKRVSVLKSFGAPGIPAHVKRIVPLCSEDTVTQIYYEFMSFYRLSGLYQVYFRRPGSFARLQAALGFEPEHVWSESERRSFLSAYYLLRGILEKRLPGVSRESVSEAILIWLQMYSLEELKSMGHEAIVKVLPGIMAEVYAMQSEKPITVSTEADAAQKSVLSKLHDAVFSPGKLNIAFIYDGSPRHSYWIMAHDMGRQQLEQQMGDAVDVHCYVVDETLDADTAIEKAIAEGAKLIFATTARLIVPCRRAAANHKGVHIFNCSVSMPYPGVRSYYCRIYEAKFISGAIAGAMSKSGNIGYIAGSPIFGVPAAINAFALGAQMTNPAARVHLSWSCTEPDPMKQLISQGIELISNRDIPHPERPQLKWGLCRVLPEGGLEPLCSPYWSWGDFYIKVASAVRNGTLEEPGQKEGLAINYWWGLKSGVVDVRLGDSLPAGVRQLALALRNSIISGSLSPFERQLTDQSGSIISDGSREILPEDILNMDWLCENVVGSIPGFDELLPMAQPLVRLLGLYRDSLPPEKEGQLL